MAKNCATDAFYYSRFPLFALPLQVLWRHEASYQTYSINQIKAGIGPEFAACVNGTGPADFQAEVRKVIERKKADWGADIAQEVLAWAPFYVHRIPDMLPGASLPQARAHKGAKSMGHIAPLFMALQQGVRLPKTGITSVRGNNLVPVTPQLDMAPFRALLT